MVGDRGARLLKVQILSLPLSCVALGKELLTSVSWFLDVQNATIIPHLDAAVTVIQLVFLHLSLLPYSLFPI